MEPLSFFKKSLQEKGASKSTVKNYLADVRNFINWASADSPELPLILTLENIAAYRKRLINNEVPFSTIKRYLASLKKFASFCEDNDLIEAGSTQKIFSFGNQGAELPVAMIIKNFRIYLQKQNISRITIKNYLCDIRNFLAWAEKQ